MIVLINLYYFHNHHYIIVIKINMNVNIYIYLIVLYDRNLKKKISILLYILLYKNVKQIDT